MLILSVIVLEAHAGWAMEDIVYSLVVIGLVLLLARSRMRARTPSQDPLWITVLIRLLRGQDSPTAELRLVPGTAAFSGENAEDGMYSYEQGTVETPEGRVEWRRWRVFRDRRG